MNEPPDLLAIETHWIVPMDFSELLHIQLLHVEDIYVVIEGLTVCRELSKAFY